MTNYSPDILNCLANLSSDEVFTSPELANRMLDLLPQELFRSPRTRFLDPCSKSGVFLREIAKRLLAGLEEQIPDLQQRIDHIMTRQVFGIACTDLTAEMSRRTLYCTKLANGKYSVSTAFHDVQGNLRYDRCRHTWNAQGRCEHCGASQSEYLRADSRETYAYPFIHKSIKEILKKDMQFDVIIGNPPYQMSFGIEGGNSSNAKSIYNLFIDQAIKVSPRYLVMITPSRWMTKTAQGIPEDWIDKMLSGNHFSIIHDYEDASSVFPGVEIKGGVSYFLWDKTYNDKCHYYYHAVHKDVVYSRFDYLDSKSAGVVIRNPKVYSLVDKIEHVEGYYYKNVDDNFSGLISPKHFFDDSTFLTSNWNGYKSEKNHEFNIKYYLNLNRERTFRWISETQLPKNKPTKELHKVYIPAAGGSGNDDMVLGKPFYGEPNSVCSQTFLVIGYSPTKHNFSKDQCENIISYIKTKFFRFLVSIKKKTQNGPRGVYQFVPLQDFSHPWTDEMLYEKYGLDKDEIAFIESMIRPME